MWDNVIWPYCLNLDYRYMYVYISNNIYTYTYMQNVFSYNTFRINKIGNKVYYFPCKV